MGEDEIRAPGLLANAAVVGALFIWLEPGETDQQRDKVAMIIAT